MNSAAIKFKSLKNLSSIEITWSFSFWSLNFPLHKPLLDSATAIVVACYKTRSTVTRSFGVLTAQKSHKYSIAKIEEMVLICRGCWLRSFMVNCTFYLLKIDVSCHSNSSCYRWSLRLWKCLVDKLQFKKFYFDEHESGILLLLTDVVMLICFWTRLLNSLLPTNHYHNDA